LALYILLRQIRDFNIRHKLFLGPFSCDAK
jgi:hypothetical protein